MADNVSKLRIIAYANPKSRDELGSMDVLLNPESYNQKIEIKYTEKQAPGTSGKLPKFAKIEPDKIEFELLFDRTGVINGLAPGDAGVDEDITRLKKLTVEYNGKDHRPFFVKIFWGTLRFDGCLETMDISYKLFNAQGLPLRAVVKTSFIGSIEDTKRANKENSQSPDLTHVRTVTFGDTLPLLCYAIYGDPKYYIEVARANGLTDFRNLPEGIKLRFPPLQNR